MKLIIPQQFKKSVGTDELEVYGSTVEEIMLNFVKEYPDLERRLFNDSKEFNKFVNIFVNQEDIRFLNGKNTILKDTDEIIILPAISGG